jgi:hypothetical protein
LDMFESVGKMKFIIRTRGCVRLCKGWKLFSLFFKKRERNG